MGSSGDTEDSRCCDSVDAPEEVVVKPLEWILSGTPDISGTAVLGDRNIVHNLDVVAL